jgi:hypothetical protein
MYGFDSFLPENKRDAEAQPYKVYGLPHHIPISIVAHPHRRASPGAPQAYSINGKRNLKLA